MDNNNRTGYYSKEDLRNVLRQYFTDYTMWMRFYIVSRVSGLNDQEVIKNRIYETPIQLARLFRIYYDGKETDIFEDLFRTHIRLSIGLVEDVIAGNTLSYAKNMEAFNDNAKTLSTHLSQMNPYLNQLQIENLLKNLLDMTLDEATKRKNMHYADDVYQYDNIEYFILMIADILWGAMVKKFYS